MQYPKGRFPTFKVPKIEYLTPLRVDAREPTFFEFLNHNSPSGIGDVVCGVLLWVGWCDDRH